MKFSVSKVLKKAVSQVLWRDRIFLFGIGGSFVLMIGLWLLSAQAELGDNIIPWHYTVYFGIDRVGPWWSILRYAFFGTVIFIINFFLASQLFFTRRLYSYIVVYITVLVQLLTLMQISALLYYLV
ncbi:MAG: hypothetical protein ACPGO5_01560 [Patescibacteria group bacterium]